jgi:hypothetical protein
MKCPNCLVYFSEPNNTKPENPDDSPFAEALRHLSNKIIDQEIKLVNQEADIFNIRKRLEELESKIGGEKHKRYEKLSQRVSILEDDCEKNFKGDKKFDLPGIPRNTEDPGISGKQKLLDKCWELIELVKEESK